jgi:lysophospholipid acyltransferase (LPLAT)-like uncharacterized protein
VSRPPIAALPRGLRRRRLRLSPAAVERLGVPLLRLLAASWRISTEGEDRWRRVYEARRPHVFVCWHEALLPLLWQHRRQGIAIVVSEAREGQYLTDLARSLGYRAVRGSSSRGGARALLGAVRELRAGHPVAFTPDGPRGPRRLAKPGVVAAAQRGGGTVVPLHAEGSPAWRLRSWDRMMIPKPFARVSVRYGVPFEVGPGPEGLAEGLARVTSELGRISGADEWTGAETPTA